MCHFCLESSCRSANAFVFTPRLPSWWWDLRDVVKPCLPKTSFWRTRTCLKHHRLECITVTAPGKRDFVPCKSGGGGVSRGDSRPSGLDDVVPPGERRAGVGRFDGRRQWRQTGVGSLHQTFPSSKHHGALFVPGHVSDGQIRQKHLPQCPLHRGFQKPQGSIGSTKCLVAIVSPRVERLHGHLSQGHLASFRVLGHGFAPRVVGRLSVVEPPVKRRGLDPELSQTTPWRCRDEVRGCAETTPPWVGCVLKNWCGITSTTWTWTT